MTQLLLHPLPLDGSAWPGSVVSLEESIAPTLYECGDRLEDWASAALDAAGSGPLDLVGISIGGSCALEVAALAPDRVRSIVFIGAKAGHRPEPDFRDEALRVLQGDGLDAAWSRYWAPLFAPDANPEAVEQGRAITLALGVDAITNGVRAFHSRPDRHEFALSLDVPVLVVTGEHDLNPPRAESFARELRNGQFAAIAGAGHYAPLEQPDALTRAIAEFHYSLAAAN